MTKEEVLSSINDHLAKFGGRISGYNSSKHRDQINWLNDHFKDTEIASSHYVEKAYVLLHDDVIEHCSTCGKKSVFGNFNLGYRSKTCNECAHQNSKFAMLGRQKNENSPHVKVTKTCLHCNKEFSFDSRLLNRTIDRTFCSKRCATLHKWSIMSDEKKSDILLKTNSTNLDRYDDKWVVNSEHSREKTQEKLGVRYSFQSKSIYDKAVESHLKNTGYVYPLQNPKTLQKMKDTRRERYGSMLVPCYRHKEYVMPSGKKVKVQGYEDRALDLLLDRFGESEVFVGRKAIEEQIGRVTYVNDGITHSYYPDIYVRSANTIYEVKSRYTYDVNERINLLKAEACVNLGMGFEFIIFD